MYTADKELFQEALLEALVKKYDRELAVCTESAVCTDAHYQAMSRIIGVNVTGHTGRKRISRRAVVAIILAAALLLSGCAIYVYRNKIWDFVERFYEKHIAVSVEGNDLQRTSGAITEVYALTYVPEGYVMTEEQIIPISVLYKFENDGGRLIMFKQKRLDTSQFYLDVQNQAAIVFDDEHKIYYRKVNNTHHYIWCDEKYAMTIKSDVELSEDVLLLMLQGITVKQ